MLMNPLRLVSMAALYNRRCHMDFAGELWYDYKVERGRSASASGSYAC